MSVFRFIQLCFYFACINSTFTFQAEACRSVAMAMKKCPHGMFAEIKYDGERVQVHKQGDTFQYFSRSLKPVQGHKVQDQSLLLYPIIRCNYKVLIVPCKGSSLVSPPLSLVLFLLLCH